MRKPVAALLALLVVLGVTFYAWSRRHVGVVVDDLSSTSGEATRPPGELAPPAGTVGDLARAPDRPRPKAPERAPTAPETRTGDLVVTLVPPEGVALPAGLRVDAEPVGFNVPVKRLALAQADRAWRFAGLAIGRWRVRAFVPGFVDASKEAEVRPDEETSVEVPLERGAIATYKVALLSGEAPETVRVALFDGRDLPREATYETPTTTVHAVTGDAAALEPTGRVIGLKPGTYRLRATSPAGESDEKTFKVAAGETATVELTIRR